jgi:hypothetical protein
MKKRQRRKRKKKQRALFFGLIDQQIKISGWGVQWYGTKIVGIEDGAPRLTNRGF